MVDLNGFNHHNLMDLTIIFKKWSFPSSKGLGCRKTPSCFEGFFSQAKAYQVAKARSRLRSSWDILRRKVDGVLGIGSCNNMLVSEQFLDRFGRVLEQFLDRFFGSFSDFLYPPEIWIVTIQRRWLRDRWRTMQSGWDWIPRTDIRGWILARVIAEVVN